MNELRKALLEERARLISEIRSLEDRALADEENDSQKPGFSLQLADSATENIDRDISLEIRSIEAKTLEEVEEALRAMESGDYGICKATGEPIELERLRVKPWARFSMKYLNKVEQRNKRSAA
jgi:DnaK suppressor protein